MKVRHDCRLLSGRLHSLYHLLLLIALQWTATQVATAAAAAVQRTSRDARVIGLEPGDTRHRRRRTSYFVPPLMRGFLLNTLLVCLLAMEFIYRMHKWKQKQETGRKDSQLLCHKHHRHFCISEACYPTCSSVTVRRLSSSDA